MKRWRMEAVSHHQIAATDRTSTRKCRKADFAKTSSIASTRFPVHLPPLRERPEDIAVLAEYFRHDGTIDVASGQGRVLRLSTASRLADRSCEGLK
jgi:transcriptional regulator with GAF, ATPase, and Fis domain